MLDDSTSFSLVLTSYNFHSLAWCEVLDNVFLTDFKLLTLKAFVLRAKGKLIAILKFDLAKQSVEITFDTLNHIARLEVLTHNILLQAFPFVVVRKVRVVFVLGLSEKLDFVRRRLYLFASHKCDLFELL